MAKATKKKPPAKAPGFRKKPAADKSEPVTIVDITASVCPFCRSTNRTPYHGTEIIRGPVRIGAVSYQRVELRRTICSDCGRRRIDRGLVPMENSPGPGE